MVKCVKYGLLIVLTILLGKVNYLYLNEIMYYCLYLMTLVLMLNWVKDQSMILIVVLIFNFYPLIYSTLDIVNGNMMPITFQVLKAIMIKAGFEYLVFDFLLRRKGIENDLYGED